MRANDQLVPLGDVVKPIRPRVKPTDNPDLPFIGMEHVEAHTMKLLGTVPASEMKSASVRFQPGDVLYGRLRPYLNKVVRPTFGGLCSAEFIVFPENDRVDGKYLQYLLNSSAFVNFATHLNAGDRPRVDFDQIASFEIPLRTIDEQHRIVAEIEKQFSRLDQAVVSLQRVKAQLKRYKASVLKAAVEGRLVETEAERARREGRGFETGAELLQRILETRRSQWKGKGKYKEPAAPEAAGLPELPEGWVLASLNQLTNKITSGSRDWSAYYGKGDKVFILAQNVRPFSADFSNLQRVDPPAEDPACNRSLVRDGDLLTTIVGAGTGQVCLVEHTPHVAYVCQSVALIRPSISSTATYLNYWLNSEQHGQRYFEKCMYGQGRPHLSFEQLEATPVALPPVEEQHRIVAEVDRRLSIVREVEAEVDANLKRAQTLRQAVLARVFSGGQANA